MRSGMHIRHITLHCSMPRFRADYGPGQEIVHALMDKLVCCTAFLIAKSLALSARQIQAQGRPRGGPRGHSPRLQVLILRLNQEHACMPLVHRCTKTGTS